MCIYFTFCKQPHYVAPSVLNNNLGDRMVISNDT